MEKPKRFGEIKDVLDNVLKRTEIYFDFKIFRLKKSWIKIVGAQLAKHTRPYKIFKNETLIVSCDHQGFINSLQFHKNDILSKIHSLFKDEFIKINDIKFNFYNKGMKN